MTLGSLSDHLKARERECGTHSLIDIETSIFGFTNERFLIVLKLFGGIPNLLAMSFFGESPFCALCLQSYSLLLSTWGSHDWE